MCASGSTPIACSSALLSNVGVTQHPEPETVADESGSSPWAKVVLFILAGGAVVFVGVGIWINSFMGGEESYLVGGRMIDEALVAANAPFTSDHLMNEVVVVLDDCGPEEATGQLTNNSDVALDATVVVRLTRLSGTYVDSAMDLIDDVPPGQTTHWKAYIFDDYDQCEADLYSVSGPKMELLRTVSSNLGYHSLTPMLMDVASNDLSTDLVLAEYLKAADRLRDTRSDD